MSITIEKIQKERFLILVLAIAAINVVANSISEDTAMHASNLIYVIMGDSFLF